jgi:ATP-binding cassette subfamily F protein uup
MKPDMGKVKLAKDLAFSYFDQKRRDLVPEDTVKHVLCPQGGEYLKVMDKTRHVVGYLRDFLFDASMVDQKVGTLSGGQKNRLLLAKVLANPKSLLILDEPTNDLDMDTLDMLEEILSQYPGTLIVVSHDRDFLDQTVSKILAFEGDGKVHGYMGGYTDYLEAKRRRQAEGYDDDDFLAFQEPKSRPRPAAPQGSASKSDAPKVYKRLTYKLQYELDNLPGKMENLQKEIEDLERILDDAGLFTRDRGAFDTASKRLAEARGALESAELRWLELEDLRARAEG